MPDAGSTPTENADLARFGYQQELKRGLSLKHLLVYGLVFMVPIAPFSIFGGVFDASHGMVPLTYLIGFVAMIFTAVSYQQMSRAFPIAGSVYSYAGRGISPSVGFLAGWSILLDYLLIPTLLYVIGANAMANVFPSIPQPVWIVAFVLVNTVVNLRGIEATAKANNVFLVGQLIVLGVFVGFAAWAISGGVNGASWTTLPFYNPAEFSAPLVFTALSVAVLSFLGFDAISTLSEETVGGNRVVGRATVIALCIVAALFVLQTYLAALLEPGITAYPTTEASNNAFYDIGRMIAGPWLQVVIALAVAIGSAVANSLVAQSATSRLLFSMARDGKLPAFLKVIHPETRIPQRAILLVAGLSLVLGLFFVGQINLLASLCNFGALTAFLLLHVSVVVHHVVRQRSRRFGVHLVVPLVGFLVIGYVLLNADVNAKVGGLTWIVVGLVIIAVFKATGRSTELRASDAPLDAADAPTR